MSQSLPQGRLSRLVYAVKPASWPKLLVPLLLGQTLGVRDGQLDIRALLIGSAFTISGLVFIVLLNDWGDRQIDRLKRAMFPDGCSPKTIPDGIIGERRILWLALSAGACAFAAASVGAWLLGRDWLLAMALLDMLVFTSYTLPPLRLNYRGGGELLEMLGVGALLPWFNAYVQGGELWSTRYWVLPGFMLMSLASAIASGLSDEQSDRLGGKTTFVTMFGNRAARRAIERLLPAGALALAIGAFPLLPPWLALLPAGLSLAFLPALRRSGAAAITNAFAAQARYKSYLHRAIWYSALALAACVAVI